MPMEPALLNLRQVAERYSIGRSSVWRLVKEGRLPAPVKITKGTTRWRVSDLKEWEARL